jgi:3-dehydroquinate synthase
MTANAIQKQPTNIFLYGPSGSGKSTAGRLMAANLNLSFLDLDDEIEAQAGMSIPEIFEREGESGFRKHETRALRAALAGDEKVISLGGGALLSSENLAMAAAKGQIVVLSGSLETLYSRLESAETPRPLLRGDSKERLRTLLAERERHYASFPLQVNTDGKDPAKVAWELQVCLGTFHLRGMASRKHPGYDARVFPGALDALGKMMSARGLRGPIVVVSDENVARYHLDRAYETLSGIGYKTHRFTIPPGESYKTMDTVAQIWTQLAKARVERGSTVVALGGGVLGDLVGFAAATYLRGVSWVTVPTSLLAMVDAGIGGKTGADLPQGKNLVGAFHPPRLALVDPEVLRTLPALEFINGMAEVLKHGVIADPWLLDHGQEISPLADPKILTEVVRRAVAVKVKIIEEDPFEAGIRAALNFGHTVGHGIELASDYQIRHGEAVSIGMVIETRMAEEIGLAHKGLSDEIANHLRNAGLPVSMPVGLDRGLIARAMKRDKKIAESQLKFALPAAIGDVQVGIRVENWEAHLDAVERG